MGTVLQVTVLADDAQQARDLADDCLREAQRWDDVLTTWRPEGELARLNARAGQGPTPISHSLRSALLSMSSLSQTTGGAFDPAIGSLVDWWRSHEMPPSGLDRPPTMKAIQLDGDRATLPSGVALDAGGIGKGIALDAMAALLRKGKVEAAFLDFGGSGLYAIGAPADSPEGWPVALSGIQKDQVLGVVFLRDASLSTSRSSSPGDPAGPILDPISGKPIAGPRLATVLTADATAADAWSTALVVKGLRGIEEAAKTRLEALIADEGGMRATAAWAKKLKLPS